MSGPTFRAMALRRLLALSVLVAAVGALAACGGGTLAHCESISAEQLSQAATTSADAPSGRFELAST